MKHAVYIEKSFGDGYMIMSNMKDKITVLVNSCDAYQDLWNPFFTLYKKYFTLENVRLILNTETENFSFDGLEIECIHPKHSDITYGERMLNVLSQVNTPYVIILLDDFFIRKPVDVKMINQIIQWMDNDKSIVYFNCDDTPVYINWDNKTYPGFHRIPSGSNYTLNFQAAIWRTEKLVKYWKPNITPWEWEEFTNLIAARNCKDKFYCVSKYGNGFCDYGYDLKGMGVHHGKWVKEDVLPLFEKENIIVDFSKRGFLDIHQNKSKQYELRDSLKTIYPKSDLINRCLDGKDRIKFYFFAKRNKALGLFKYSPDQMYIRYMLLKERKKFIKKHPELLKKDEK